MKVTFGPVIQLPTNAGDFMVTHVVVSLDKNNLKEGVLLYNQCPDNQTDSTLVRVQSSCLFSESFWATDCDCAMQLHEAMERMSKKCGYLLYFYEEGRGAGLITKFRAIELQQIHKYDTKKAYECLNIETDVRRYEAAALVIKEKLGNTPITLLTNNPNKTKGLIKHGINIIATEPLICGMDKPAIKAYLEEKAKSLGHKI